MKLLSAKRNIAVILLVSLLLQSCGVGVPIKEQEVIAQQETNMQARPTLEVYASCPANDISRYIELKTHCAPCKDLKPSQLEIMPPPAQPTISQPSTKPSTCGVCQEIVSYTFTNQQGYPVHFAYHRGIWEAVVIERLGSFSRSEILPVVCENNGDIGQFLSGLKSKSSNYVQRHIHVAHSQQITDPVSFVYLGKQGLRGGASDAVEKAITSIKALVEALNAATQPTEQAELSGRVREVVTWFNDQSIGNLTSAIMREYVGISHLAYKERHRELLEDYFFSLTRKISETADRKYLFMQAISYSLTVLEDTLFKRGFQRDRDVLIQLAQTLLHQLGSCTSSLSRENYYTYQDTFYTICHVLAFIGDEDLSFGKLAPSQEGGLYQEFRDILKNVRDNSNYYPFRYNAQLIEQFLVYLQCSTSTPDQIRLRGASLVKGLCDLSLCVSLSLPLVGLDYTRLGAAISHLKETFGPSGSIFANSWFKDFLELKGLAIDTLLDAQRYTKFEERLNTLKLERLQKLGNSNVNKLPFYFSAVRVLRLLSCEGSTQEVRKKSIETLSELFWNQGDYKEVLGRVPSP